MSVVIGVHDGHNASVAVMRDGRLELALQEERLTRVKNQGDAPAGAARMALALAAEDEVSTVALNGCYMNYHQWERGRILDDYKGSGGLRSRLKQPLKSTFVDRAYQRGCASARAASLSEIGFRRDQLTPVEHHQAHAAAAYYTSPWRSGKVLVLTCDGSGDRLSATVSIGGAGELRRLAEISEHDSIGRLYSSVTSHLGMAPLEHEYKVMGLAAYGEAHRGAFDLAQQFRELFEFTQNPLVWRRRAGVPSMYACRNMLARLLEGRRFDVIAGGVQRFLETMLTEWVGRAIRETGIARIACSGGVFMNVKCNLAILELPEVEEMYVFPSCGDESNSIGAACWEAARRGDPIEPLGALYYGDPITDKESEEALETPARAQRLRCRWMPDIERKTAQELAAGKIVARAKGAAEFGARALGNRSILARADSPTAVSTINRAIKSRDFWMPFAPSVLAERTSRYYLKPKPVDSPHMMFAFRSHAATRSAFAAAQHPYDFTTRPHEVSALSNPCYYRMLEEYEAITGEAIVLNTSFNLHGHPLVHRATDAVAVFLGSGLQYLALGNWWVEKT